MSCLGRFARSTPWSSVHQILAADRTLRITKLLWQISFCFQVFILAKHSVASPLELHDKWQKKHITWATFTFLTWIVQLYPRQSRMESFSQLSIWKLNSISSFRYSRNFIWSSEESQLAGNSDAKILIVSWFFSYLEHFPTCVWTDFTNHLAEKILPISNNSWQYLTIVDNI